jgi:hypothetical protein
MIQFQQWNRKNINQDIYKMGSENFSMWHMRYIKIELAILMLADRAIYLKQIAWGQ